MLTPLPIDLSQTFALHSNPNAKLKIYLDFDGHTTVNSYWNTDPLFPAQINTPAFNFEGTSATFTNNELTRIQYIWQRVAEDYAPFNVDVTTEDPGLAALQRAPSTTDEEYGVRCVIGGSSMDWFGDPNSGGVSYLGIFGSTFATHYNAPAFVFPAQLSNGNEKNVAEAISHEVGHYIGLDHDGTGNAEYYEGANGWAPIMGAGYEQPLTQWSRGEYTDATNQEDDLAIIANKLGYRSDDYGNTFAGAYILTTANSALDAAGIIGQNTDADYFKFTLNVAQTFNLNITAGDRDANLDILAKLYNANQTLLATSNSTSTLDASFSTSLAAGTYYVSIEGTGKTTGSNVIYSDYASIGTYSLHADVYSLPAPTNLQAVPQVSRNVNLTWNAASGAAAYEVYWLNQQGAMQLLTTTSATSYTTARFSVGNNTLYVYALDNNGNKSAAAAVNVSVTGVLPAPTNLQAVAQVSRNVNLTWNAASGATSYEICWLNLQGAMQVLTTTSATSYTTARLAIGNNTLYVYSLDSSGNRSSAATVNVTVNGLPAPANLQGVAQVSRNVNLTWNAVSGAAAYEVYWLNLQGAMQLLTSTTSTAYTTARLAVGNNTLYVYAVDSSGVKGSTAAAVNVTV